MTRPGFRARCARAALTFGAAGVLVTLPARAQDTPRGARSADTAAVAGDLDAFERRVYEASRRAPRDPTARAALGEWLASRGQLRSGAVLLEEARLFGGDAVSIAARLVHIYPWLRDWSSLAALPSSPLTSGEKVRARRLAERDTDISGADSVVVPFAPLEVGALGRVPLRIGADTLWAEVDPQVEGLVLPGLGRGAGLVEVLATERDALLGIVQECALGELTLRNLAVRVDTSMGVGRARIGFDVFARMGPTVDARAGTVTFRRDGRVGTGDARTAVPFVLGFPGVRVAVRAGAPLAGLTTPAGRAALRGMVWTVDVRRGVIWVDAAR